MSKLKAGNIKKGQYLLHNGQPHYVTKTQFVSPGKGSAFTRAKLRHLKNGATTEFVFKSHDTVEEIDVESQELQFLYGAGDEVVFMNPHTYDQVSIDSSLLGDKINYLVPEIKAYIAFYQEKPIGVSLPPKVVMEVTEAQDAIAGDRSNAGKKPVTMETGLVVQAPLFIKKGQKLIIDTETGEYVSKSN